MPCNYKLYHPNWKKVIRPAILDRAKNCCEQCKVKNYSLIIRGEYCGIEVYQDDDGNIYNAETGEGVGSDYLGEVHPTNTFIKVVLTIAHMNHNINDNDYSNLKALCQQCHNRHDVGHRKENRRKNKGMLELF